MRLEKLKIRNFRSFNNEKETVIDFNELTTFIGNNSTGKTGSIHALLKLFGEKNRSLVRSDFHLPLDQKAEEIESSELYIEAIFKFPELENGEDSTNSSIPIFYNHFVVEDVGGSPYIRIRLESTWEKGNTADGTIDTNIYFITVPENAEIEENHKKSASNSILSHIKCLYVPAARNPSEQLKIVSGSILYRVLKGINWSKKTSEDLKRKMDELNTILFEEVGIDLVKSSIQSNWSTYHSDSRYDKALLTLDNSDMDRLLKNIGVKFSPTVTERDYDVNELGDGLRSLFYLSLVNSLLEIEDQVLAEGKNTQPAFNFKPPVLTIVAVEEPENHIAPHLLGKVVENLVGISNKDNAQTILTSHSPAIIKRVDSRSIRHFRIDNKSSSVVKPILLPDKAADSYKFVKGSVEAYPELYFAKLVVLGEGDSEEFVIEKLLDSSNYNIDSHGISIVPLGGRHVNHFWKLLNDLDIPHITLLDLDLERHGGGWGRIKYAIEELIKNGISRGSLLTVESGEILSKEKFSKMDEWSLVDDGILDSWLVMLERFNVFFSFPLDLDFMLLESFLAEYKKSLEPDEGPRLKIDGKMKRISDLTVDELTLPEYEERLKLDTRATLKESGGNGDTYGLEQRELMLWYNYFFLSKSKPVTHMRAFKHIDISKSMDRLPNPLQRLLEKIQNKLTREVYPDFLE